MEIWTKIFGPKVSAAVLLMSSFTNVFCLVNYAQNNTPSGLVTTS
jgi:hypothetical protein